MPSLRRLAAIMFTDLVGFTRLGQRDEEEALRLRTEHQALLRPLFAAHGGREVKSLGDGFLVEFPSAVESVNCAGEIQRAVARRNSLPTSNERIMLRVGIHLGEVVDDGTDIVGDAVNVASRIEPLAEPGGVCVSRSVFEQVRGKVPWPLEKLGSRMVKNVDLPVEIFRLVLDREAYPSSRPGAWVPLPDPDGRFSTGITSFDRLLGGGFRRGSMTLFAFDETVGTEDLDLLLFPILLNNLQQSRGVLAILPSRDSPHAFRSRLTRFVSSRRFDRRVRICDYVGEDDGLPYVLSLYTETPEERAGNLTKIREAEQLIGAPPGGRFLELVAFEVFETLRGAEGASRDFFHGVKRVRQRGNLGIGLLGPGLACAAAVRRMTDTEFLLLRNEAGLVIRGLHPAFPSQVVSVDPRAGPPHVILTNQRA